MLFSFALSLLLHLLFTVVVMGPTLQHLSAFVEHVGIWNNKVVAHPWDLSSRIML